MQGYDLNAAARIIQLALTLVFLLSGIATLLNVFASRLERVAKQADELSGPGMDPARESLKKRSFALDAAVLMAAIAGALTCATVLVLFVGEVYGAHVAFLLFAAFGGATTLTIGALAAFVYEMLLAARGVRKTVDLEAAGGTARTDTN